MPRGNKFGEWFQQQYVGLCIWSITIEFFFLKIIQKLLIKYIGERKWDWCLGLGNVKGMRPWNATSMRELYYGDGHVIRK